MWHEVVNLCRPVGWDEVKCNASVIMCLSCHHCWQAEKDSDEEIKKSFQLFEDSCTGVIVFGDLKRAAEELGENLTDEEIQVFLSPTTPHLLKKFVLCMSKCHESPVSHTSCSSSRNLTRLQGTWGTASYDTCCQAQVRVRVFPRGLHATYEAQLSVQFSVWTFCILPFLGNDCRGGPKQTGSGHQAAILDDDEESRCLTLQCWSVEIHLWFCQNRSFLFLRVNK